MFITRILQLYTFFILFLRELIYGGIFLCFQVFFG